jgi:predicted transcriptional regulator
MKSFKFDPTKHGLQKTLKRYEEIALRYIWDQGEKGAGSRKTWKAVTEALEPEKSISKTSVIFFLGRMVDQGVLDFRTVAGKGGYHRVYYPIMDERSYKKYVMKTIVESMMKDFPAETREALNAFN